MEIWTYRKHEAPSATEAQEWFAYIYDPEMSKHTLPIRFEGATEQEAIDNALTEYNRRADHRAQVKASREEAARKRLERAKKKHEAAE